MHQGARCTHIFSAQWGARSAPDCPRCSITFTVPPMSDAHAREIERVTGFAISMSFMVRAVSMRARSLPKGTVG
jgi:hypothetical protein